MNCVSSKSSDRKGKKGKSPTKMKPKKGHTVEVAELEIDVESPTLDLEKEETTESGIQDHSTKGVEQLEHEQSETHLTKQVSVESDPEMLETTDLEIHKTIDNPKQETIEPEMHETIEPETDEIPYKSEKTEPSEPAKESDDIKENEREDIIETHQEDHVEAADITEAKEGIIDSKITFDIGNTNDTKENTNGNEGESQKLKNNQANKSADIEFNITEGSLEDDFVLIEVPGETNDDPSDTSSVKIETNSVQIGEPFSEFIDSHGVGKALKAQDAIPESDMDITAELLLQYLTKGPKKQLKSTVRKAGWPITDEIRTILWKKMCQHLHKADADDDIFTEYNETLFSDGSESIRLPSFVDFQHTPPYFLNKDGVTAAKKVLGVLEVTNPEIVYSPMLYPLVCLFLHYMGPSDCYNCVYALLRSRAFISQTKVCYEASKGVIRDLAKKHAKSGYIFLVRHSDNIDGVFESWLWWILQDLPFHFLIRVFDCYLLEGVKVFYRVILSIIIHFAKFNGKKSLFSRSDVAGNTAIVSALRQFCQDMPIPIDKFFKTGFGIRGLRKKDIQKLQLKHEMYVNSQRHIMNASDGHMTMSRSFSGPIILQNLSSSMLTADMLLAVWTWLPTRYAVCQPELLYTSEEHGISLVTLYQRVENHQPTIIVIKTTTDEIFGAFCSTYWKERRCQSSNHLSYFGTGETFLFTLWPEKKKYQWVGLSGETIPNTANMFQAGDRSILTIGGGHGEAIYLDENLVHCRTEKCDTFGNEPLSQNEDFMCKVVEVYGFQ